MISPRTMGRYALTLSAIPSGAHGRMMECASGCGFVGSQDKKFRKDGEYEDYGLWEEKAI